MNSGMTAGRVAVFMVAVAMWIAAGLCVAYEANVMAGLLFLSGFFLGVWVISASSWEYHNDELMERRALVEARTKFAMSIAPLNPNQLQVIGLEYPELGVDFGVEPVIYLLEDGKVTGILLACLQKFLADSNASEFADLRRYNDDKYLQQQFGLSRDQVRKQWQLATDLLLRKGFLVYGSMTGSHTYQWKSKGHYKNLTHRYAIIPQPANVLNAERLEGAA